MITEEIKKFFDKHPKCEAFYLVNDSLIFLNESRANEHGGKIEKITRSGENKPQDQGGNTDAAKAELLALELDEKADYNVLKRLVGELGLQPAGNKKTDYIAVLDEFKQADNEGGIDSNKGVE